METHSPKKIAIFLESENFVDKTALNFHSFHSFNKINFVTTQYANAIFYPYFILTLSLDQMRN